MGYFAADAAVSSADFIMGQSLILWSRGIRPETFYPRHLRVTPMGHFAADAAVSSADFIMGQSLILWSHEKQDAIWHPAFHLYQPQSLCINLSHFATVPIGEIIS